VGYFSPLGSLTAGVTVRSGDVLGHVDVLGVRQDVVAPADGVVGRYLAEAGEAVEYGQELVRMEAGRDDAVATAPTEAG
ncbi:MAG TPA: biotin/lipoyl-containing protein, partial [Candidatus Sulfotelmatobacter sp.]|nr:biotin/lipoyl-containing protein [Candidatus Sulfotelmatobacter sp.]